LIFLPLAQISKLLSHNGNAAFQLWWAFVLMADAEIAKVDDCYAKAQMSNHLPYSVCAVDILASVCLHDLVGHNLDII
jgi:hypothetical protein